MATFLKGEEDEEAAVPSSNRVPLRRRLSMRRFIQSVSLLMRVSMTQDHIWNFLSYSACVLVYISTAQVALLILTFAVISHLSFLSLSLKKNGIL